MTDVAEKPPPNGIIKSTKDLSTQKIICKTPDRELAVYPRWIVFHSETNFKDPLFVKFFIENRDKFPVIFTIKAKQKIFRLGGPSCGFLKPGERRTLKLFLLGFDDWPLGINDYSQKRLKLAVENLRIPSCIQPENEMESISIAKNIWKKSMTEWPLERLYTKINVGIHRGTESSSTSTSTGLTQATQKS